MEFALINPHADDALLGIVEFEKPTILDLLSAMDILESFDIPTSTLNLSTDGYIYERSGSYVIGIQPDNALPIDAFYFIPI